MTILNYTILYILLGAIISLINWIYCINTDIKNNNSIIAYLTGGLFLWPLIIIEKFYRD